jgi:hypothetical protein
MRNVSNRRSSPPSPIRNKKGSSPSRSSDAGQAKKYDYKVDVTVAADATPIKTVTEEQLLKEGNVRARLEARKMLFQKSGEKGYKKLAGIKSGSRVVPYNGDGDSEESTEVGDRPEEFQSEEPEEFESAHKDEDLSKIRMQLVQIENQQTNLLDLLQVNTPYLYRKNINFLCCMSYLQDPSKLLIIWIHASTFYLGWLASNIG